jgi:hypothetical protein
MKNKTPDDALTLLSALTDFLLASNSQPPIASIIVAGSQTVYHVVKEIKEKTFNKKLSDFLQETKKTTDQDRLKFIQRLGNDEKRFWERVLLLIEKMDDEKKAKITGRLCHALILEQITLDYFFRLALIIERTYLFDLEFFQTHFHVQKSKHDHDVDPKITDQTTTIINNLVTAGLLYEQRVGIFQHGGDGGPISHRPTELGELFLKCGF